MKDENFQICLNISKELDDVVEGNLYKCPHCGNYFKLSDAEETTDDDGDTVYTCPNKYCKEPIIENELNQISIYDYFADAFDIEYIVNYRKEYQAIRITIATDRKSVV